jgi:hypothetical protein
MPWYIFSLKSAIPNPPLHLVKLIIEGRLRQINPAFDALKPGRFGLELENKIKQEFWHDKKHILPPVFLC